MTADYFIQKQVSGNCATTREMVFHGEETANQSFRMITNWVKCKESYFSFRKNGVAPKLESRGRL